MQQEEKEHFKDQVVLWVVEQTAGEFEWSVGFTHEPGLSLRKAQSRDQRQTLLCMCVEVWWSELSGMWVWDSEIRSKLPK